MRRVGTVPAPCAVGPGRCTRCTLCPDSNGSCEAYADIQMQKLQPFFPPMDQLQSTNLRSALLRSLDHAKKNGILGRDTVLRKTMLDECKGERLEEILAVFSSAVLKKMVNDEHATIKDSRTLAQSLALEKRGHSGEPAELTPLILAHRVSLKTKLDQKNAARAQYKDFARLLDLKERGIARLHEETYTAVQQAGKSTLSQNERTTLRRAIRNNWTGNERWMDTLLYGDAKSRQDGVLSAPLDRVWRRVRTGQLQEIEDESTGGLLEEMDGRVRVQQARLEKWQNFRKEMFGDISTPSETDRSERVGQQKGIDLGFGLHESLQLGGISSRKLTGTTILSHGEYRTLMDGFETELKQINQASTARPSVRLRGRTQHATSPTTQTGDKVIDEPLSELSELEEELASTAPVRRPPTQRGLEEAAQTDDASNQASKRIQPKLAQPLSSNHVFRPNTRSIEISPAEKSRPRVPSPRQSPVRDNKNKSRSPVHSPILSLPPSPRRRPPSPSPILRTQSPEALPPSPTQQQADQILASMSAASPSPVKQSRPRHKLSLAERTRLSMMRGAPVDVDEEDEAAMSSPSPTRSWRRNTSRSPTKNKPDTPNTITEHAVSVGPEDLEIAGGDDLVARTRRSMANFEATQQKARLEKQRSLKRAARQPSGSLARQSYFPSLEEQGAEEGASDDTAVVLEELIAKEAEGVDYESVFKSRPKIKTSPPSTPARGGGMEFE